MTSENIKKEPFVRVAKRPEVSPKKAMLIRFSSILVALLIGGLLSLILTLAEGMLGASSWIDSATLRSTLAVARSI